MKKALFTLALGMLLCAIAAQAQTDATNPFPWDFPQKVATNADEGQWVLAPYTFYPIAIRDGENLLEKTLIFYSTKMTTPGEEKSVVGGNAQLPNALIIPLDKNARAKKGDIILTWWQSGSGLERAIVTDDSDPTAPKVDYLDMDYGTNDNPGFAQRYADDPIKPGTFTILKDGEWQPGAQLACRDENGRWNAGILIREQDGKVLSLGFASKVEAYDKANVRLVPFKQDFKRGENVCVKWVSFYREGYKVVKVDKKIGRIWVEKDGDTEVKAFGEVTKPF